ncbi:MAG TPA: methionyl-tRNA formyltransferase [Thermodesulfobacteriota bacterium]
MKVLFLGTAEFACPTLEALLASPHEVIGVVTQPDRPKGRGQKTIAPPVKSLARKAGLPVHQPEKIRDPAFLKILESIKPELMVVAAYGQILSAPVLAVPPRGCVNVHGSLLPKYRGAAPIVRAILAGETRTGITTMFMDPGMDTGPILLAEETDIGEEDTAGTLHDRLARIGARLLLRTLEGLGTNTIIPKPQDPTLATLAPKIEKEEARIRWSAPARQTFNQIRAFDPWPGAFTLLAGRILKLFRPRLIEGGAQEPPGTIVRASDEGLRVAASQGYLLVREAQVESRPRMRVSDFLRGNPIAAGERLGE